ncbi:(+)-larreatricin hydroxylase, chloroplastic [Sesamum angolense]|uniref:(+)-larreatricin hydroxylase, chloroplastic n=1 Tax=Sesamum angolense TaxID=2727404 RepID=A0AAE2BUG2_9LAMI|nr:(+)-larreatricin hydroxylase, chloroplastic [Sesamum angolense]
MASSHLPCATTISAAPPLPSSHPLFAKPTHFLTHAKRSPRLQVSCAAAPNKNDSVDDTPQGKVDRRNMLLGLGGLYGATNLVSTPGASANPIQPPELDKCGVATNAANQKPVEFSCCPPYNLAIDRMKRLPQDDPRNFLQQANIHCAYCNGAYDQPGQGTMDLQVHESWLFFPFHRWYLYFYERILGKLIGDPTFALPFWNWDNPKGMTMPPMFVDPRSALYDEKRNPASLPPAVVDLGNTKPSREGGKPDGAGSSERGSHTSVHIWVGDPRQPTLEDLGNFYSAGRDPLFYCHHANVDRMWTLWQYFLPSNKVPDKRITDPDFLNAAFLFYDENAQLVRVTVKDCLDNLRMGYDFERIDLPWLDYRPPRQTAKAKVLRTSSTAPKASTLFPLNLDKVVRFQVDKTKKGKADELLVLENVTVETTKFLKFDVFINDEDDNATELDKAAYLGTYAQVPHKTPNRTATSTIRMKLTDLYDDMDIEDDDSIVVTLVPRHEGPGVTIGGIKIIEDPEATKTTKSS